MAPRFRCDACGAAVAALAGGARPKRCARCGTWERVTEAGPAPGGPGRPRNLAQGEVARPRERRLRLGGILDDLFGGLDPERAGFLLGGTYVLSGDPGAGKSTLLMQEVAGARHPDGRPIRCCYVGAEGERHEDVRDRALRLGRDPSNVDYLECDNVVEAIPLTDGYELKVYDSLDANLSGAGFVMQRALDAIVVDAAETGAVALVIRQVNSGGHAAGPVALDHRVTALAHLELLEDEGRLLEVGKNRGGQTWKKTIRRLKSKKTGKVREVEAVERLAFRLEMTAGGLVRLPDDPE